MRRSRAKFVILLLTALIAAHGAIAAEREQPVELTADRAEMDSATGVGIYTGNVVLTQGGITITGDRMSVHTTERRELDRVIVEGRKASFERRQQGAETVRGEAPRMEFHAARDQVELTQGASLWQGKNEFSGEVIEYDLESGRVRARGDEAGERRIRITIFPRDEDNEQ